MVIMIYGIFLKSKLNLPDKYEKTEKVWTLFIDPRKMILFIWTYQLFEISLPGASKLSKHQDFLCLLHCAKILKHLNKQFKKYSYCNLE